MLKIEYQSKESSSIDSFLNDDEEEISIK